MINIINDNYKFILSINKKLKKKQIKHLLIKNKYLICDNKNIKLK